MTTIKPTNLNASLKAAVRDGEVTQQEAAKLTAAALKDLIKSDDQAATLKLAAENLSRFLEPFRARDSQEEGGVWLGRTVRYEVEDLVNKLTRAAEELTALTMNPFEVAMGMVLEDGKLSAYEAKDLGKLAQKLVDEADDPAAAAQAARRSLLQLESLFAQSVTFGMGGPTRDDVLTKTSSKHLATLNAFLGTAIAKGLDGAPNETVSPHSEFAEGIQQILDATPMERNMLLETLPYLVDQEVGMYDATGLVGPARLKMEQQAAARGRALLAYVDGLGSDVDDIQQALFRIVTGRFLPDDAMAEFKTMVSTLPGDELRRGLEQFKGRAESLKGAQSYSVKNEVKGLLEGVALLEAELARRADLSGLSSIGSSAEAQAVLDFLAADPDVAAALADGAKLDGDSVKTFTWDEAKAAIKRDFSPDSDLDVVLQNMTGDATMFRRDLPDAYAFARVTIHLPDEPPFPLTVVLKKGDDGFAPVRRADGGIPFEP